MRLIGLHGRAGAGKDTIAAQLIAEHDYGRMALAGPLKDMLITGLREVGVSRQVLDDRRLKEQVLPAIGKSPRELMQTLGTEWGRQLVCDDLWLKIAQVHLQYHARYLSGLVITDVRFDNEANWVRAQGGEIWHVLRRYGDNVAPLHLSEHGIEMHAGADSVIVNDAGLEQLKDQVRAAFAGELRIAQASA